MTWLGAHTGRVWVSRRLLCFKLIIVIWWQSINLSIEPSVSEKRMWMFRRASSSLATLALRAVRSPKSLRSGAESLLTKDLPLSMFQSMLNMMIWVFFLVFYQVTWMRICKRRSTASWRSEGSNRASHRISLALRGITWQESIVNGSRTSSLLLRIETHLCFPSMNNKLEWNKLLSKGVYFRWRTCSRHPCWYRKIVRWIDLLLVANIATCSYFGS